MSEVYEGGSGIVYIDGIPVYKVNSVGISDVRPALYNLNQMQAVDHIPSNYSLSFSCTTTTKLSPSFNKMMKRWAREWKKQYRPDKRQRRKQRRLAKKASRGGLSNGS
jgi:tagatose-1,6-bisphosphate aldolase non-catalytic subunit AgaZ/GatZ